MDGTHHDSEAVPYGEARLADFLTRLYEALTPELRAELHQFNAELERIEQEGDPPAHATRAGSGSHSGEPTRARLTLVEDDPPRS